MEAADVLVVGAGYAGLSAALTLGRACRSVLVAGDGPTRNARAATSHGFLTRDGGPPAELLAAARRDVAAYPAVRLVRGRVDRLSGARCDFKARVGHRTVAARRVILATGAADDPPPIPGLAEHWGHGVHVCPYCDGWEHRDEPIAVLGEPDRTPLLARTLTGWTGTVLAFGLRGPVGDGVTADERRVVAVTGKDDAVTGVDLDDGSHVEVGAVFVAHRSAPRSGLARSLGCALDERGFICVDAEGRTSVPGVWAAGDVAHPEKHQVAVAVADGLVAARSCNADLLGLSPEPTPAPV